MQAKKKGKDIQKNTIKEVIKASKDLSNKFANAGKTANETAKKVNEFSKASRKAGINGRKED